MRIEQQVGSLTTPTPNQELALIQLGLASGLGISWSPDSILP